MHKLRATPLNRILAILCFLLVTPLLSIAQTSSATRELHFFVIDRSGSMGPGDNNLVGSVTDVFREQISKLPSNAEVRLVFFSSDRTTTEIWRNASQDQSAIMSYFVQSFSVGGQTRLYDTVAESFEEILRDQANYDFITLQIFSDGGDNASTKSKDWALVEKLAVNFKKSNPNGVRECTIYTMGKLPPLGVPQILNEKRAEKGSDLKNVALAKPEAKIEYAPENPAEGTKVKFMAVNTGTGIITSYAWNIDGNVTASGVVANHVFTTKGTHTVQLTVNGPGGNMTSKATVNVLPAAPKADFQISPSNSVGYGDTVTLRAINTQSGETYQWTIAGKRESTAREMTWTAAQIGGVEVALTVTNSAGSSEPRVKVINVAANPPNPAFTLKPNATTIKLGDKLTATAVAQDSKIKHTWTLAGQTISTSATADVAPSKTGAYELVHTASWAGGTDKASQLITIASEPPPASFTINPGKEVDMGAEVTVKADTTNTDYTHTWTFSNGQTAKGPSATITVNDAGMLKIAHKVVSSKGDNTANDSVYVRAVLKVDYTTNTSKGDAPLSVKFTPKTAGNIVVYKWDFGDGATSDDKEPVHVYKNTGKYQPRLIVQTAAGQEAKSQNALNITVTQASPAWLKWAIIGGILLAALLGFLGWKKWQSAAIELSGKLSWEYGEESGRRELRGKSYNLRKLGIEGWEPTAEYIIKGTNGSGLYLYKNDVELVKLSKDNPATAFEVERVRCTYRPL